MKFEEKKEITDRKIITSEETRVIKRIVDDLLLVTHIKNKKFINTFSTLQKLKNIVAQSVEVFWHSHKMRLNVEKIYLGVLEGLFVE